MTTPESQKSKLLRRTGRCVKAHYRAANVFEFWDKLATMASILGGVLLLLAGVYVEFLRNRLESFGLLPGLLLAAAGFAVFALTTCQALWKWGSRSEKHRLIGARYAAVRRSIEGKPDASSKGAFSSEIADLDSLGQEGVLVPDGIWRWAEKEYSQINRPF